MTRIALAASLFLAFVPLAHCGTDAVSNPDILVVPGRSPYYPLPPEQKFGLGQGFLDLQTVTELHAAAPQTPAPDPGEDSRPRFRLDRARIVAGAVLGLMLCLAVIA